MFRALLAHPQEALNKQHFGIVRVYNVSWLWHGSSETAVCATPPEDDQVILETYRDP
jgi:hypothetical protein